MSIPYANSASSSSCLAPREGSTKNALSALAGHSGARMIDDKGGGAATADLVVNDDW